jgi:hypothetical protein
VSLEDRIKHFHAVNIKASVLCGSAMLNADKYRSECFLKPKTEPK